MSRRVSLPGASELFRPTTGPDEGTDRAARKEPRRTGSGASGRTPRSGSGRVRHDEKITVYISTEELLALEAARLSLRSQGIAADRGRIVREAVAIALADLERRGEESALSVSLTSPPTEHPTTRGDQR